MAGIGGTYIGGTCTGGTDVAGTGIGGTDVAGYLRTVAEAEASSGSARWAAAAALWEQVVERNPVRGSHWGRLGEARFELNDYRGALPAYQRAAELGVWGRADHRPPVPRRGRLPHRLLSRPAGRG